MEPEVERWSPCWDHKYGVVTTQLDPQGQYVLFENYEELRKKYEELCK